MREKKDPPTASEPSRGGESRDDRELRLHVAAQKPGGDGTSFGYPNTSREFREGGSRILRAESPEFLANLGRFFARAR